MWEENKKFVLKKVLKLFWVDGSIDDFKTLPRMGFSFGHFQRSFFYNFFIKSVRGEHHKPVVFELL